MSNGDWDSFSKGADNASGCFGCAFMVVVVIALLVFAPELLLVAFVLGLIYFFLKGGAQAFMEEWRKNRDA